MSAMMTLQSLFTVLFALISIVTGARILGIVHMPVYSHFQLGDRIFRELASRGHEVTFVSSFEVKEPVKNLKNIVLTGFWEEFGVARRDYYTRMNLNVFGKIMTIGRFALYYTEQFLKHPNVRQLLNSKQEFDLIIYENFQNEAFSGFSYHYNAPYVLLSTMGSSRWTNPKMGNPNNPAYVPDLFLSYSRDMNFFERTFNSLVYIGDQLYYHFFMRGKQDQLLQQYFPGVPCLYDLMYNSSLFLLNSHPATNAPVPLVPNMIEIGGFHIRPSKPLRSDLKELLDEAKDGVVYFSMGSNIESKDMQETKLFALLSVFGKLKEKVLWKWEANSLPGQPANVKVENWLPQQDILAHPNVKLFITHGGLLSIIEAAYFGVPVFGIPVYADQQLNIRNAQDNGYGVGVPYEQLTEGTLSGALNEVLNNKSYTETAKRMSRIIQDQPTNPLDRAVFWIEYVIRHQGAPHLKTAALNLTWYQYLLLDVVAVSLVGATVLFWMLCRVLKFLCVGINGSITTKEVKKEN